MGIRIDANRLTDYNDLSEVATYLNSLDMEIVYQLVEPIETPLTAEQIAEIENKVNEVIARHLPVTEEYCLRKEVPAEVDLEKLPADASNTLRLVRVGDYDVCACIGAHVQNTAEIGSFKIISHTWESGTLRLRFKLL